MYKLRGTVYCKWPLYTNVQLVLLFFISTIFYQASVKNFQLIRESQPDVVIMQFGKLSEEKFILDFRYSLSFKGTVSRGA
jgi:hypothetical protein